MPFCYVYTGKENIFDTEMESKSSGTDLEKEIVVGSLEQTSSIDEIANEINELDRMAFVEDEDSD